MNTAKWFRSVYEHTTLPAIYTTGFIIGLGANVWGLKSLLQKWKILGHINVFLLNLGIANFLFLPTLPFFATYYFMGNKWIFGEGFCKITRFCFNLNLYGSIGFLTCISVYRYLAIVHPMKVMGRITVTHSVAISVVVWLLVECGVERAVSMGCSYTEERRHRTLLWDEDNARESGTHWGFVVIVSVYFTVNKCAALH
uniref:Si:dkey-78k11.9 n=1 Tax=Oreochromis niloticus TaxID=8128 RepID=A0A669D1H8_ORENI